MAEKKSEDVTTWACSKGCNVSKTICPHLEKLLPNIDRSQVKLSYRADIDKFSIETEKFDPRKDDLYYNRRLKALGLSKREINLFSDKYIDKFTLDELTDKYPEYGSRSNVDYALRKIKKKLKEGLKNEE